MVVGTGRYAVEESPYSLVLHEVSRRRAGGNVHRVAQPVFLETIPITVYRDTREFVAHSIGTLYGVIEMIFDFVRDFFQTDPLPNFHPVGPINQTVTQTAHPLLYRGGKPKGEGYQRLKDLGIHTVVDLRVLDTESREVLSRGMDYVHIPMRPNHPSDEEVLQFLRVLQSNENRITFVHCTKGGDRTGFMIAAYRIILQGVDKEEAIAEMTEGPFRFSSFMCWTFIDYLRNCDVEALRSHLA